MRTRTVTLRPRLFERVQVKVEDGAVELSGQAAGWFDRDAAERLAWPLPGVRAVINCITLPDAAADPNGASA